MDFGLRDFVIVMSNKIAALNSALLLASEISPSWEDNDKKGLKTIKLCNWTLKGQPLERMNQCLDPVVVDDEFWFLKSPVLQIQPRISPNYFNCGLPNGCLEIGNQRKSASAVINSWLHGALGQVTWGSLPHFLHSAVTSVWLLLLLWQALQTRESSPRDLGQCARVYTKLQINPLHFPGKSFLKELYWSIMQHTFLQESTHIVLIFIIWMYQVTRNPGVSNLIIYFIWKHLQMLPMEYSV